MTSRLFGVCILVACLVAMASAVDRTGCGNTKACYSDPEHCNPSSGQCDFFLSFKENGADNTKIDFELVGNRTGSNGVGWVGVAFSYDKAMGNDSGVMCINEGGSFLYRTFFNYGQVNVVDANSVGLSDTSNGVSDGIVSCSFTRAKSVANDPEFFDLSMDYYLLMGTGPCNNGVCAEHEALPVASLAKVNFNSTDDVMAGAPAHHSSEEVHDAANDVRSKMTAMVAVMVIAAVLGLLQ